MLDMLASIAYCLIIGPHVLCCLPSGLWATTSCFWTQVKFLSLWVSLCNSDGGEFQSLSPFIIVTQLLELCNCYMVRNSLTVTDCITSQCSSMSVHQMRVCMGKNLCQMCIQNNSSALPSLDARPSLTFVFSEWPCFSGRVVINTS